MIWENLTYLWWLLLLPVIVLAQWWYARRKDKKLSLLFSNRLQALLTLGRRSALVKVQNILFLLSLFLFILALAGPKIGTQVKEVKRKGVDLMIALDLSNSMNAEDIKPSRLSKSKFEIRSLLDNLNGDRVGLIVFTGSAFLQSPMTLDYSAMRLYLNIAETDQMPSGTTNFASAMSATLEAFDSLEEQHNGAARVLLIISDGEDQGESYQGELKALQATNIIIFALGVGTSAGATIPTYNEQGQLLGYKRDQNGKVVTTKLSNATLREIAQQGGGSYFELSRNYDNIDGFLQQLDQLQKGEFAAQEFADYKNQYQVLLLAGLASLLIGIVLPTYKKEEPQWT